MELLIRSLSRVVQWRADRLRVQIFSAGSRQGDLKSNFRQKLPDRYEISRKGKMGFEIFLGKKDRKRVRTRYE